MSQRLINTYMAEIDRLRKFGGTSTEQVIREAFKDLLKNWARSNALVFIPELQYDTNLGTRVYPDGTILHDVRVPLGYWEAKDTADKLDDEIAKKRLKGYPQDNILYENSETCVLWQNRVEVLRCKMSDLAALERLLTLFFGYQRPEIAEFRSAVQQFKTDLPAVLTALRDHSYMKCSNNINVRQLNIPASDLCKPTLLRFRKTFPLGLCPRFSVMRVIFNIGHVLYWVISNKKVEGTRFAGWQ